MKYKYIDLKNYAANRRGVGTFASINDTKVSNLIEKGINILYEIIFFTKFSSAFSTRKLQFLTQSPFTTGTAAGTSGEHYLTISGTTLTSNNNGIPFKGAFFVSGQRSYKIVKVDIPNNRFVLEAPLAEEITAGSSYKVYFIEYPLRWDIAGIKDVKRDDEVLAFRPEKLTPPEVETGEGELMYPAGIAEEDYDSGTGTPANGSATVTSVASVDLDTTIIGKAVIFNDEYDIYYILDVDSGASTIILDREYQGSLTGSQSIRVNPRGTPIFGIKPFPESKGLIQMIYTFQPPRLEGDNDITLLPTDIPMMRGIDVITTKWESVGEKGFINEVLFQNREFKESLSLLSFRGTTINPRMFTLGEFQNRRARRDTNPWNRFRGRAH